MRSSPLPHAPLGDLVRIKSGGTPSKGNIEYWGDDLPWITAKDLKSRYLVGSIQKLSAAGRSIATIAPVDALLILVRGMGLFKGIPIGICRAEVAFNQDVKALIPGSAIDGGFLYCALESLKPVLMQLVEAAGHGTGRLDTAKLLALPIPLPPLPEQRRIAAILGTWDAAIEKAENVASRLDGLESLYFRKLILEPHSRLDNLASGWTVARLDDLGRIASGGTPSTNDPSFWNGNILWCTPTEITALTGRFIGQTEKVLSRAGLQASSAEILPTGSLVVCTRATVGACAITTRPMATNQGFKSIIPNGSAEVEYLYFYIRAIKHDLMRLAAGSTFAEIPKSSFEKIRIAVPPHELRQRLIGLLAALEDRGIAVRSMMDHLARQKTGLMQKLLSGQVRVPEAVADLSPAAD